MAFDGIMPSTINDSNGSSGAVNSDKISSSGLEKQRRSKIVVPCLSNSD